MFSHVMVGVSDLEKSKRFYDALLGTIGVAPGVANKNRYFYRSPSGTFAISTPIDGAPATHGNGSTIGFLVQSPEQGDAFHAAGIAAGGTTCEDPPGFRDGPPGTSTWPTCATPTATSSAPCTGRRNRHRKCLKPASCAGR